MTLNAMLSDLYRRLGFPATPSAPTTTRLTAFLNEAQGEIFSQPGFELLLHDVVTFASVANTPEYSLPPIVSRINAIIDPVNLRSLDSMSSTAYRKYNPSPGGIGGGTAISGLSSVWVDLGYTAVSVQPTAAAELFVISTSASDGATKSVTVEGYLSGGTFRRETVALNGLTGVSVNTSVTNWIEVTKFELVLGAGGLTFPAGFIELRMTSGAGTLLAQIPSAISQAQTETVMGRYRRIALVPTPASVVTYTVHFEREPVDMINATDEPMIPRRFHRLLVTGARMKEYEKTDNTRYLLAKAEYDLAMKDLTFWIAGQAAGAPNLRSLTREQPSRLGGWFPSVPY